MVALPPRQFDRNRPRTRSPITSGTNGMETSRLSTAFSTSQPRRPKKSARSSSNPGSSATTRTGFVHALAYKRETTHRPRNRSAKAGENGVTGASWQVPSRVTADAERRAHRRRDDELDQLHALRWKLLTTVSRWRSWSRQPGLVVTTTDLLCSAFEDWRRVFTHARGGKGRGREGEGHEGCRAEDRRFWGAGVARAWELSRSHAGRRWSCGYGHVRRLERLIVGQEPRANLRRLKHALRGAPPQLRARVLRLLRAEMRRLRQGGLTRIERERYRRLHRILDALSQPGSSSATQSGSTPLPAQRGDRETGASSAGGAPNAANRGDSHPFTGTDSQRSSSSKAGEDRDVGGFGSRADLPPAWEWNIQLGIYLALLGLLLFALAALLLAAVPADALPTRQLQRFVHRSRAALALMGASTLVALALIVFL